MTDARVSVVIPAYNAEGTIARAINSVLDSCILDLEVIVIDDCSSDATVSICQEIGDSRLRVVQVDHNQGVAHARNIGLTLAVGKYIAFLDSDDYWYKDKLSRQLKMLEDSPSDILGYYTHLMINGEQIRSAPPGVDFDSLIYNGNDIALSSTIVKRSATQGHIFESIGHEDYKFWLDLLAKGGYFKCSSSVDNIQQMTFYHSSGDSLSSNKIRAGIWTFNILWSVLPLPKTLYFFSKYVIKHLIRLIN